MKHPVAGLSYDFIFPKLHGMWSRAVVGDTLHHLVQAARPDALERALAGLGVDVKNRSEFQKRLTEMHIDELARVARLLDRKTADFYDALIDRYYFENLKTILHYHHFPSQDVSIEYLLIQSDFFPALDLEQVTSARNVNQLVRALPDHPVMEHMLPLLVELDDTKDLFVAESRLDRYCYGYMCAAARRLPRATRELGRGFVAMETDIENLIMALRNAAVYQLDSEILKELWIEGGERIPSEALQALADSADEGIDPSVLPKPYVRIVEQVTDQELYVVENDLWNLLYASAYEVFSDFDRPSGAVVAFPYLKRFELLNIGRVYEGIHFGLAPDAMQSMMIGVRRV